MLPLGKAASVETEEILVAEYLQTLSVPDGDAIDVFAIAVLVAERDASVEKPEFVEAERILRRLKAGPKDDVELVATEISGGESELQTVDVVAERGAVARGPAAERGLFVDGRVALPQLGDAALDAVNRRVQRHEQFGQPVADDGIGDGNPVDALEQSLEFLQRSRDGRRRAVSGLGQVGHRIVGVHANHPLKPL